MCPQRQRDLRCGKGKPSRGMEDQVYRNTRWRAPDSTENFLTVINIDVLGDRYPEQGYGLLPMDESYHLRFPVQPELEEKASSGNCNRAPLRKRDDKNENDNENQNDNPEDINNRTKVRLIEKAYHYRSRLFSIREEKKYSVVISMTGPYPAGSGPENSA
jgi:hypothetical protein